jgi:hypothetical protein
MSDLKEQETVVVEESPEEVSVEPVVEPKACPREKIVSPCCGRHKNCSKRNKQ